MVDKETPRTLRDLLKQLDAQGITDCRRYDRVKDFLNIKAREKAIPLMGTFEITPFCNLDCKMCYVHLNANQLRDKELLTYAEWERIISEAIDAGMMYATLTGGECLTSPDFDKIYLYLHSRGIQITVFTNAVLLDEKRIEFFKAHPPARIQATLYGVDEETYERVTGRRMFERVMHNIMAADNAKLPLVVAITPNQYLGEQCASLIRYVADKGLPIRLNTALFTPRNETGRDDGFYDMAAEEYAQLILLKRRLKGQTITSECIDEQPEVLPTVQSGQIRGLRCGAGRSGFKVMWDGHLIPCDKLVNKPISLLQESFAEAWIKIHCFAQEFLLPIECESCAYKAYSKGCPAEHNGVRGHADPEQCKWCKALHKAGL